MRNASSLALGAFLYPVITLGPAQQISPSYIDDDDDDI
jgi:hypothetical protein